MKKNLSIFLGLILILSISLAACNKSNSSDQGSGNAQTNNAQTDNGKKDNGQKVTLKFWKAPHIKDEKEAWTDIIKKFEDENPNIKIEFMVTPWDTYQQQYTAAFAGSNPPDVSYQTDWVVNFAKKNKLADLGKYLTADQQSHYSKSAIDYATVDGKLVGRPFIALTSVMFYNKAIFEQKQIKIPQTWDEFVEAAKKATEAPNKFGVGFITNPLDYWQPLSYLYQSGASIFNKDMTKSDLNTPEGVRGLQFVTDLFNKYKVAPPMDHFSTSEQLNDAFYKGNIAMVPSQLQFGGEIKKNAPNLQYGVFPMPAGSAQNTEQQRWSYSGIGLLSIAEDSKHKDEAYKFIDFITKPEIEKIYLEKAGFFSPQVDTNKLMYQNDPILQTAGETIKNLQVIPPHENFAKMLDVLQQMFEASFRGAKTPEQAVKDASNEIDKLLQTK